MTTEEIAATVRGSRKEQRANHAVVNAGAARGAWRATFRVPPYVLGAWLGDGHSAPLPASPARPTRSRCTSRATASTSVTTARCCYSIKLPERPCVRVARPISLRPTAVQPYAGGATVPAPAVRDHGSFRRCCARSASSTTSTSRQAYLRAPERAAARAARRSARHRRHRVEGRAPCSSPSPASGSPTTSTSWSSASATAAAARTKRVAGRIGGDLDLLHPELLDDRRRLPAERKAAAPQGASARADWRGSASLHHRRPPGRERARCGACRSTTTTTSTSPASR